MASGGVVLALVPTILALTGPSLAEVVPLMLQRPALASLVVLGAPSVNPIPVFGRFSLERQPASPVTAALRKRLLGHGSGRFILTAIQVVVTLGAIANAVANSLELDTQTIICWTCSFSGMTLMWNFLGFWVHWIAVAGFHEHWLPMRPPPSPASPPAGPPDGLRVGPPADPPADSPIVTEGRANPRRPSKVKALLQTVSSNVGLWVDAELTPCMFRTGPPFTERLHHPTVWSDIMFWIASTAAIVHYCYGTIVFSSLLFISTDDATVVLARYAVSAGLCRMVLLFELDCMRLSGDG